MRNYCFQVEHSRSESGREESSMGSRHIAWKWKPTARCVIRTVDGIDVHPKQNGSHIVWRGNLASDARNRNFSLSFPINWAEQIRTGSVLIATTTLDFTTKESVRNSFSSKHAIVNFVNNVPQIATNTQTAGCLEWTNGHESTMLFS